MFWVPPESQILKEFCYLSLLVRPSVTRIALMVWVGRSARVKIAPVNLGLTNHILFLWITRWKSYCKVCRQKGRHAGCREDGNNGMAFSMVWPPKHNLMTFWAFMLHWAHSSSLVSLFSNHNCSIWWGVLPSKAQERGGSLGFRWLCPQIYTETHEHLVNCIRIDAWCS